MPFPLGHAKRAPEYQAGDHDAFRDGADAPDDWARLETGRKTAIATCASSGANSPTLFDGASPANILAGEVGEFF
jgi:hypothetical protein